MTVANTVVDASKIIEWDDNARISFNDKFDLFAM